MKPKFLRVASDLHLEAFTGASIERISEFFLQEDERDKESILLLAGDICSHFLTLEWFLTSIAPRFMHVVYCPGNHEYYKSDFDERNLQIDEIKSKQPNLNLSVASGNVEMLEMDGVRIIFGALWGDGGQTLAEAGHVAFYLNDFRLIKKNNRLFTVDDMKLLNFSHRMTIEFNLKKEFSGKTVVMTHHLPSYSLCHPRFGTDCNGGFASHCDRLMHEDYAPDIWVYGHTHDTQDNVIGKTRVLCNPAGYRGEWGSSFNHFHPLFIQL